MEPGARLDHRYRLDTRIGHGAVGDVWRARDLNLGREVAVKTIRLGAGSNDVVLGRFRREVDAAASLNHGNVVSLHDAGRDGDVAYLVMELLEGPSVADLVTNGGPVTLQQGLTIGEDVALGLVAAHRAGIIHRDVKPANAVLHQGRVKIVDFGIARLTEHQGEALTETGFTAGTAAYLSPEQARGDQVEPRSDVYSLGCLLFALFTGQPPFPRDLPVAQALAHLTEEPPRLRARRPGLPEELDTLVHRMLAKDPADRPTSAEVADALAGMREGDRTAILPTGMPVSPLPQRPSGVAPRRALRPSGSRWPGVAAAAVLVAALTLGFWQLRPDDGSFSTASVARPPATTPSPTAPIPAAPAPAPSPFGPDGVWTPIPKAPPTTTPATTSGSLATTSTRAPVDLGPSVRAISNAIAGVANPGARRQLEREWGSLSSGLTPANAGARLDQMAATVRSTKQLTDAERSAILAAIGSARRQL